MLIITYVQNLIYDISHTECWVITYFGPLSVLHVQKEYFQWRKTALGKRKRTGCFH